MNIVSLEDISKSYGLSPLYEGVSFGLEEDEKAGIIGANGSGKSTLLRIIAGLEQPDSGRVVIAKEHAVACLAQDPAFDARQTVLDAVFSAGTDTIRLLHDYEHACQQLAASGGADQRLLNRVARFASELEAAGAWGLETEAKTILSQLGIHDTAAVVGMLSGGERKRVALAHALVTRPDLLLLDEPTNHLDAETIGWLEVLLAKFSGTLLLVTHDRYFLERVTHRIIEIDRRRVQSFAGSYSYYLEKKEEQEAQRAAAAEKRKTVLRRELAWLRRGAKARTAKQRARVDRAQELIHAPRESEKAELDISVGFSRIGKKILELQNISKAYGGTRLLERFSYTLKRSDRIGLIGSNGCGKTTMLDIIAGRVTPDDGHVEAGQTVVLGYYDQENRELDSEKRVIDYIREVGERVETADGDWITASQMLEKFLFPPATQYDRIGKLSGGERRRLYLLRVLMSSPNVLLLDEPTNDFDIPTLVRLEEYLDAFPGCLIVASHDRYFLDRTVEHVFRFEGGGELREYPGNYSAFLEIREREASAGPVAPVKEAKPAPTKSLAGPRKLSYKERIEFSAIEARIDAAEVRKAEVEAQLATASSDFVAVQRLSMELESLTEQLERDINRWAELAELT